MKRSACKESRASEEHIKLSTFIKGVHKKLREDSKEHGWEETWKQHCNDTIILNTYANAMKNLACTYWQNKETSKDHDRIEWIFNNVIEYFNNSGIEYQRDREEKIASLLQITDNQVNYSKVEKIKLLDVGSCYNPFKKYDIFDVTAIDIAPSDEEVLQCDFLNIQPDKNVLQFQFCTYNVIVFSLFLEYLPKPELRLKSCQNAYDLLADEGILAIVTPDSKHVGANAKFMKSWRYVLAKIGFCRIKYEKLPFIHCMIYRKNVYKAVAQRWSSLNQGKGLFDQIYIPQDLNQQ